VTSPEPEKAYEAARQRAAELAGLFAGHQVVTEAELATRGICPVSIAHGSAETDHDAELIFEVVPRLARGCGTLAGTRGGGEHTTYLFTGPGASTAVAAFTAAVLAVAPRWWRITPTACPQWHTEGGPR
jgi:hypothetical protein